MKVGPMFFSPSPIQIQPFPLPSHNDNGGINPPVRYGPSTGIVPIWLQRDLGVEAVQVTVKGHEGWRADFTK